MAVQPMFGAAGVQSVASTRQPFRSLGALARQFVVWAARQLDVVVVDRGTPSGFLSVATSNRYHRDQYNVSLNDDT